MRKQEDFLENKNIIDAENNLQRIMFTDVNKIFFKYKR